MEDSQLATEDRHAAVFEGLRRGSAQSSLSTSIDSPQAARTETHKLVVARPDQADRLQSSLVLRMETVDGEGADPPTVDGVVRAGTLSESKVLHVDPVRTFEKGLQHAREERST